MSTETFAPSSTSDSLFIGLESYTEAQSNIFFGRDGEIDRLTGLIKANTLTIVFGKSGTGKTSLLNAGVFPKLRKDYFLPFRIRLEFKEDSPELITQIKIILKSEIDKYGFRVESYPDSKTTLWEYFHSEPLWKSVTPILIFDQFEEIFTLAKKSNHFGTAELSVFWEELGDLIENSIPEKLKAEFLNEKEKINYSYKNQKVKIVFAFREEFLPEFESITAKIPSLKTSRFRLMPMNGNQAYEVITKTWKNKIDKNEADKIVGFFTNEEYSNKSFELMEIEPSLLSQVCTYIDKERISEGQSKISSDFLERYPKEKILHSIYNEVLNESNQAVLGTNPDLTKSQRPVNEFLEDKLITDEGYRTKYSISEIEKALLPGIEVLKRKYFVRDDGKSIELTHDVLAPIIKDDRETRRKGIAVADAKKRANKRALIIVIFALVAAAAIWYFIAGKAVSDKNDAIKKQAEIEKQITIDSASLAIIKDSIIQSRKNHRGNFPGNGNTGNNIEDTPLLGIKQISTADSLKMDSLQQLFAKIDNQRSQLKNELALQDAQITELLDNKNASALLSDDAKRSIQFLQRRITLDSTKLTDLQEAYAKLSREFYDYKMKHPEPYSPVGRREDDVADTNSLKLNLHFELSKTLPRNLLIYLIPDNSGNAKIIRKSRVYEIGCDVALENAMGKKIAKFKDGLYVFYNVPPGKYFIKVCSYYGGFEDYTKTKTGNVTIKFDASPPIR
ncbi:MAG: ATP-binding protein [Ginsengibacter sp.]